MESSSLLLGMVLCCIFCIIFCSCSTSLRKLFWKFENFDDKNPGINKKQLLAIFEMI